MGADPKLRLYEYDVTWTMYSVEVALPEDVDPDSETAYELASERAAAKLRDVGPDREDVECTLGPEYEAEA